MLCIESHTRLTSERHLIVTYLSTSILLSIPDVRHLYIYHTICLMSTKLIRELMLISCLALKNSPHKN